MHPSDGDSHPTDPTPVPAVVGHRSPPPPTAQPSESRSDRAVAHLDPESTASPFAGASRPQDASYFARLERRIRWRVLIAYVTPLVLLSVYFHGQYSRTVRARVESHLQSIAENQRNTVNLYLQERVSNLRSAFDFDQAETFPVSDDEMAAVLQELREESEAFVDAGLFAPDGTLAAYAGPYTTLEGLNYAGEEWFQDIHQVGVEATISDVYLGFRGKPHFIIAVRRDVAGQPWVLRASLDPAEFDRFVGSSHLLEGAEAFIVDADGRRQSLEREADLDVQVPLPEPDGDRTVIGPIEVGGQQYLGAVAPLSVNDWSLMVRVPEHQAYASMRQVRLVLVVLLMATGVLIVVLALRSTHRLILRLRETDSARGDLQRHLFNAAKLASVGEMAADVAHEINNPLAIIAEEAGYMRDVLDPEFGMVLDRAEFDERLGVILAAAMRGRNITRHLLAFSREDEPRCEPVDVNALLRRVVGIKETEFLVSDIEVGQNLDPTGPTAMGDPNQIEQVLLNLFNNARDAMPAGGSLALATAARGGSIQITVADTGCGMAPELLERVFFPFFTTKEVGKGTGLGLSISYGIVKSMGGRIEVDSEVGVGTTFVITLPATADGRRRGTRGDHV